MFELPKKYFAIPGKKCFHHFHFRQIDTESDRLLTVIGYQSILNLQLIKYHLPVLIPLYSIYMEGLPFGAMRVEDTSFFPFLFSFLPPVSKSQM